ncbi:MAG TPA: oxidoreductase [Sulfitobacter pontiacus]|jgi:hypothetical protein|nr:oxidoreductase [Sulfitobacter pontiacus]|tara:strand:- start:896 stop:1402 length:507 start_codon:yes stop_codon:yes gene_type:complete
MFRALLPVLAFAVIVALPVSAKDLSVPEGDVILTVSGPLETTNVNGTAQFDLEMLEALDATTFETSTIWTEGEHSFIGVSLAVLADWLGLEGDRLRATAINDYAVEIPLTDAVEGGPIVAYRMDGDIMSVRDKGPLWIIYPYDSNADYRTEVVYSRSIWQLDRIKVVE